MSPSSSGLHKFVLRAAQIVGLVAVCLVQAWSSQAPESAIASSLGPIASLGFLLLAGSLLAEIAEPLRLPHLSAYLLAGLVAGPHVYNWVDEHSVQVLAPVNTLALALIALAGGVELRSGILAERVRSLAWATGTHCVVVFVVAWALFVGLAPWIPFAKDQPWSAVIGFALLWGVLAVSRSPSACLAVLAQTRASGPLATFSLAFIMLSDVVVLLMMTATLAIARPLVDPSAAFSLADFHALGFEIVGSVAVGTTLGLLLAIYLRLVGEQLLVVLLVIGFGLTDVLRYVHFDPLLAFLTAGFFVQNFSKQGEKLLHAVHEASSVVFVAFFATAGAHLDLPLLAQTWPVACALCLGRAIATYAGARWASRHAGDEPILQRYGWCGLVSQAGLTLGLSIVVERAFPAIGPAFRSLVIATVAINEIVGPIFFKLALDRAGESRSS